MEDMPDLASEFEEEEDTYDEDDEFDKIKVQFGGLCTKLVYRVGICGKVLRNVSHLHHFCNCFFLFHFVVTHIVYSNKYFKIVWSFHRHVALLLFVKIAL